MRMLLMLYLRFLIPAAVAIAILIVCRPMTARASEEITDKAKQFVKDHEARIKALEIANNKAWWDASISGKDEDFQKKTDAQNKVDKVLSNAKTFAVLKDLREKRKEIDDAVIARCIDVLYLQYLEKQLD